MTRLAILRPGRLLLPLMALLLAATGAGAASYDWSATPVSVSFGGGAAVPMWAFVDAGGHHSFDGSGPLVIREAAGNALTINLTNNLPEPTSLIIKGQAASNGAPVMVPDANGVPRVHSFVQETAPGAGGSYQWNNLRAGTYLITSGSHPAVQGPMGLYAVLVVEQSPVDPGVSPGVAYSNPANPAVDYGYDRDQVLLFSSVDPTMNGHVADGSYGSPTYPTTLHVGYDPQYFLVNGQPFSAGRAPLPAVQSGRRLLVRLVNADIVTRIPTAAGPPLTLLAEDGYPYRYPKPQQNSVDLPAGKTADALFTPAAAGYLPIFDRRLGLTNAAASPGGMLAYLPVADPAAPMRTLTVNPPAGTQVAVTSAPGGLDCRNSGSSSCSQAYLDGSQLRLHASAGGGLSLTGWSVTPASVPPQCPAPQDCVVTLGADTTVTPTYATVTQLAFVSPATGEPLQPGSNYLIQWVAPATMVSFDLGYSLGKGSPWVMLAQKRSTFSFLWSVPGQVRSSDLRLALIGYDAAGAVVRSIETTPLTLRDSVSLVAPNGGETFHAGEVMAISWSAVLAERQVARVGLWYQTATGGAWTPIVTLDGNPNSYDWTIPATLIAPTVRLGVTLYDSSGQPLVLDSSDQTFAIDAPLAAPAAAVGSVPIVVSPSVTPPAAPTLAADGTHLVLLSPNGGEFIPRGSAYSVFWQDPTGSDHYGLDYSTDQGANWQPAAAGIGDTQYNWEIPAELRGNPAVLLRVTAYDGDGKALASDVCDAPFALE